MKKFISMLVLSVIVMACTEGTAPETVTAPNYDVVIIPGQVPEITAIASDKHARINVTWAPLPDGVLAIGIWADWSDEVDADYRPHRVYLSEHGATKTTIWSARGLTEIKALYYYDYNGTISAFSDPIYVLVCDAPRFGARCF